MQRKRCAGTADALCGDGIKQMRKCVMRTL